MAWVCADDARTTAPLDGLAFGTDFLYGCAYFHEYNGFNETVFPLYRTLKINASPCLNLVGICGYFATKPRPLN